MLADLGFYCLFLAALLAAYATIASIVSGIMRHRRLYRSAKNATYFVAALTLTACLILWFLFFQRDYTVAYIFKNSSNDLPSLYTLTAFWSSLEGSHTLWTLLLTIFAAFALATASKDNEHILPWVTAALCSIITWMLYMAVTHSDPFVRMFPPAPNGQGMNALLQNPYMAIHPPTLFIGYTTLSIPFAYAIAALCYGDVTEGWLRTTRRWSLAAFLFLSAGVWLGGRWAYVELGWAGYWAWDPVENSSFIPWLLATALLHSLLVQEKLGHLKRLTIVLAVTAFFMSFFGTFLTRSGIVSSVHSFAESPIGPSYLKFLAALLLGFSAIFAWRAHAILPASVEKAWGASRETMLIVTQFLLLTLAAIVVIGTLFPIISEAVTGQRTSIQAPYFNAFAPWIGLGMIVLIAIGNLMRYQTSDIPDLRKTMIYSLLGAIPLTGIFSYFGEVLSTPKPFALGAQLVGIYLCSWSFLCLTADLHRRWIVDLKGNTKLLWHRNRAYLGAFVAHVGVLVAILGFLGNYRGIHTDMTISAGETKTFQEFSFTFNGITTRQDLNATLFEAPLKVMRGNKDLGMLYPAKSKYPTKPELLNEIGVRSSFWNDLYIVIADFDKQTGKTVTLQVHKNPTVRLVWISVFLLCIGSLIAISDRFRGQRSRDVVAGDWQVEGAVHEK
ncbi:MAG: heme lyase CcmF/NrfE family subunit [Proteobacteria bacterium]|nr:heme lyase CcmF/NrfE family subunit [Pseudomonadota bacterium]